MDRTPMRGSDGDLLPYGLFRGESVRLRLAHDLWRMDLSQPLLDGSEVR